MDLKELCRTCLRTGETMVSIFSLMQVPALEHTELQILEIVKIFTDISLSPNDDLPDNICYDCLDKIRRSYIFKLKLRKSEAIMKQVYVDEKEVIKSMSTSNEYEDYSEMHVDLIKIENTEHFEKSIDQLERTSSPEHSTTKAEISIVQEVKQETEIEINIEEECEALCDTEETSKNNDRKRYKCELCLNKFRLKVNLMEHMLNDHNCGLPNDRKFECTICSKLYTTRHSVHIHMREVHREKPFQCEACPNKFLFRSNLWEHMRKDHPCEPLTVKSVRIKKIAKIKCELCSKLIPKQRLNTHMKMNHAVGYQCEICLIEFQFKLDLRDHMIKEHDPRSSNNDILKCSKCPRLFINKKGLNKHMKTHLLEKVKCTTCLKVFNTKVTLYRHNRMVHRGFQCELCPKMFELKNNLRQHLLKDHETYNCTLCSKVCIDKNTFIEHLRTHSGEKTFQCEVCPNYFRTEHNLKNHVQSMHDVNSEDILIDTEKSSKNCLKLKCEICSKLFINENLFIEHLRIHSGEKPFQCTASPKKISNHEMYENAREKNA